MIDPAPTTEAVASTLQDYLRAATETGALRGTQVEFTHNGYVWADVLLGDEPPAAARATVHRDGQAPTSVTVVWSESLPVEGEWRTLWLTKPHALFGAFGLRAALRRAFADVLGDRREPDEHGAPAPQTTPDTDTDAEPVDWMTRVEAAGSVEEIDGIHAEIRASRQVTQPLHQAIRRRRRDLADPAPAPAPEPAAEPVAESEPLTAMQVAMREAEERAAAERAARPTPPTTRTRATRKADA